MSDASREAGGDSQRLDPRANRVAIVHRQARPTMLGALGFCLAAAISAITPHGTGQWLPLHLFLAGGLLSAISGATQLLAVTWSASPAPPSLVVRSQHVVLAVGVVVLAGARELDASPVWSGVAGALVVASLVILGGLLLRIRQTAKLDRFRPAIDGYLVALAIGIAGSVGGAVLAAGHEDMNADAVRSAHLTANLLGTVGIVIAVTLPYILATQARTKMSEHATARSIRAVVAVLTVGVLAGCVGWLFGHPATAAAGCWLYVAGIAATVYLCPRLRRRQLRWAGPRVALVVTGVLWWAGMTGWLGASALQHDRLPDEVVLALVVGGYAQILLGSLAYLGPVLRGGGHERLAAGFRLTRSPLSLVMANLAALGLVLRLPLLAAAALAVWVTDTVVRGGLLVTTATSNTGNQVDVR